MTTHETRRKTFVGREGPVGADHERGSDVPDLAGPCLWGHSGRTWKAAPSLWKRIQRDCSDHDYQTQTQTLHRHLEAVSDRRNLRLYHRSCWIVSSGLVLLIVMLEVRLWTGALSSLPIAAWMAYLIGLGFAGANVFWQACKCPTYDPDDKSEFRRSLDYAGGGLLILLTTILGLFGAYGVTFEVWMKDHQPRAWSRQSGNSSLEEDNADYEVKAWVPRTGE